MVQGRRVQITAVFGSVEDANAFMTTTPNASVIAAVGRVSDDDGSPYRHHHPCCLDRAATLGHRRRRHPALVFIADKNDRGIKVIQPK